MEERTSPWAFPSTEWSAVRRAALESATGNRAALSQLLERYWPALRAHLLGRRHVAPGEADDLLQGFVASRVLEHDLVRTADPSKGRFRALLLTALDRYVSSQWRAELAIKRGHGEIVSLEQAGVDPPDSVQTGDSFDVAWARQVITQAMARMHGLCQKRGRQGTWLLFEEAIVRPALEDAPAPSAADLAIRWGLGSSRAARNALITVRRMFIRVLRQVIREYARDGAEVEEELVSLRRSLLGAANGDDQRIQ